MKTGIYEHRRQRLLELLRTPPFAGRGGRARLAKATEKEPSYISRLAWEATRKGSKRMGEDMAEAIEQACNAPGWFAAPLGTSRDELQPTHGAAAVFQGSEFSGRTPAELARAIATAADELARLLGSR